MTNAEVIQTMTVAELYKFLSHIRMGWIPCTEKWLRSDSQTDNGLLTEYMKELWRVH